MRAKYHDRPIHSKRSSKKHKPAGDTVFSDLKIDSLAY
jgi:hypothetical protein